MPKIYKYDVEISDGVLGWTHGWTHTITEFWIPKYGICFNLYGEQINIMEENKPRNSQITEFDIPQHIINLVLSMREMKRTLKPELEKLYDDLLKEK
jgi:hypothetical protein